MPASKNIAVSVAITVLSLAATDASAQTTKGSGRSNSFVQTNVFSNVAGAALELDPALVDAWGVAFVPNGPFWVNATGSGLSLLYDGSGAKIPVGFTVPTVAGSTKPSAPTGIVWNPTSGFLVPGTQLPAVFIMSTLDGTVAAWAPGLPTNPTTAVLAADNASSPGGASYTGLAFATTAKGAFLYAPNIVTGRIDVFDTGFQPADGELAGSFSDPAIPPGYTPFNLCEINGTLVVTYAKQNASHTFVTPAAGAGYVSVFDNDGRLIKHVGAGGLLNAPWGIAQAPAGIGEVSNKLLIGNFGDGRILAFGSGRSSPEFVLNQSGAPMTIPGLWTLTFGGASKSDTRTLYFSAGPNGGAEGIVGELTPSSGSTP